MLKETVHIFKYTFDLVHITFEIKSIVFPYAIFSRDYLSIYGSTALVDLGGFFNFLIYMQSVRFLGRRISLSQG
jgi:hypothetical protein